MSNHRLFWLLFLSFLISCSSNISSQKIPDFQRLGNYYAGYQELEFEDKARNRLIKTALWYPTHTPSKEVKYLAFKGFASKNAPLAEGSFPLLLVSHGTGGHRYNQYYLSEALASHGYIVAALEHPFNNAFDNQDQGTVANLWNRPKDVSFVLDQLLNNQDLTSMLNQNQIGFIGHSIGGYTGFVLAGAIPDLTLVIDYCREYPEDWLMCNKVEREMELPENDKLDFSVLVDTRIKALMLLAPALGQAFEKKDMVNVHRPVLLITSGQDEVLIKPHNIQRYLKALPESPKHETFPNAGHYVYLHECPIIVKIIAGSACRDIGTPRAEIHPQLQQIAVFFFHQHFIKIEK